MEFEVRLTRREGRLIPRWQLSRVAAYRGHLIERKEAAMIY